MLGYDWSAIWEFMNARLFNLAGTPVTALMLLTAALVLTLTFGFSKLAQRATRKALSYRGIHHEGTVGAVSKLLHYALVAVGFGVAIRIVGIDLGALFAAGAIFAVGLGFAMQSITQNFVSGVILLVERSIKPGDILEVEKTIVRVLEMGIRATVVRTRDGEDLIVPNSVLIQSTVKNYTLTDSVFRMKVPVGVVYKSDMKKVRSTLEKVAQDTSDRWAIKDQPPQVLMTSFGSSSVDFEIAIWMSDPWKARPAISELHESVWWAFQEQDITIAFPQVDVHFDPPVHEGLGGLSEIGRRLEARSQGTS